MFVKCKVCERQLYILDVILDAAQIDYRPTRRLHRVKSEAATIAKTYNAIRHSLAILSDFCCRHRILTTVVETQRRMEVSAERRSAASVLPINQAVSE